MTKTNHDFYIEALDAGLCGTCHKRQHRPNKTTCPICAARMNKYYRERREKLKSLGLCPICKKRYPTKNDTVHCNICNETNRIKLMERYNTRKKIGVCVRCGKSPCDTERTMCSSCLSDVREIWASKLPYRFATLERDGFKCRICNRIKSLHVHHIDGNGETTNNPNNDLDNLITLCSGCHMSITKFRSPHRDKELAVQLILA